MQVRLSASEAREMLVLFACLQELRGVDDAHNKRSDIDTFTDAQVLEIWEEMGARIALFMLRHIRD